MHRYILHSDLNDERLRKYKFRFANRCYADKIDGMPTDDDTNYVVLAQQVIEKYGRNFTAYDVSRAWLTLQSKDAYCTAERVAFCNFVKGFEPPESAKYKNPYREWIGAQIRGDYFGYINPGNPELAAEMAYMVKCLLPQCLQLRPAPTISRRSFPAVLRRFLTAPDCIKPFPVFCQILKMGFHRKIVLRIFTTAMMNIRNTIGVIPYQMP